ncbi:MAG: S-adenosylmethionine synthetase, partial [Deltaproteobacteria bacterium]|nr:S-adenosylmethionine synthetase [Deltaproteobacteria bacterium]
DIAIETARGWFQKNLRFVDGERDVRYRVVLAPGSEELTDIFARKGKVRGANDTSAAVGYAPFTPTEEAVFGAERFLNSLDFKKRFPGTGEDVKVMGLRRGNLLELTVAMPLLASFVKDEIEYFEKKQVVLKEVQNLSLTFPFEEVKVCYNTLDKEGLGLGGVYLSLLGTSAEDADSGQVGRGNRVNGVISLNRPMGTEAAAGKNPVSHVGKIYTILAHELAKEAYYKVEGITEVYIWLLSQIGMPVDRPQLASAQLILKEGVDPHRTAKVVEAIIEDGLSRIGEFCKELAEGRYPVC